MKNQRSYTYSFLTVLGFVERLRQMKIQSQRTIQREEMVAMSSTEVAGRGLIAGHRHTQSSRGSATVYYIAFERNRLRNE
ncbi:hypothetical protein MTR_2g087125 [Medicago truncatula]|uniref:Uncharacterized protein n=1 Tax=Medicago truncatula TaxID=3880 RepID=A0A072VLG9_MEDTR|nr:hypothetical protein MTR_2g087125 [Medicago truncatula]